MLKTLTSKDIDEGKRISALFSTLSEESKTMAVVYLSALRDKEIADSGKKQGTCAKEYMSVFWTKNLRKEGDKNGT